MTLRGGCWWYELRTKKEIVNCTWLSRCCGRDKKRKTSMWPSSSPSLQIRQQSRSIRPPAYIWLVWQCCSRLQSFVSCCLWRRRGQKPMIWLQDGMDLSGLCLASCHVDCSRNCGPVKTLSFFKWLVHSENPETGLGKKICLTSILLAKWSLVSLGRL